MEENVFTEISTSKDRNFACVDFVDTPGLVDGEMEYPVRPSPHTGLHTIRVVNAVP